MLRKLFSIRRYPEYLRLAWWRTVVPYSLHRAGLQIGEEVKFFGSPIVSLVPGSKIIICDRVNVCSRSEYTALGVNHPVILRTLRKGAAIEIGADTGISGTSICAATGISIGAHCLLGANVTITDTDFHAINPINRRYNNAADEIAMAPVVIEDNVFIGANSIVLKGVRIGKDSVIGAGAIVTRNIQPGSIVVGSSANVIRTVYTGKDALS